MFFAANTIFRSLYWFALKAKPNKKKQVPFSIWSIVKGDRVQIRTGDDKGKISTVMRIKRKTNQVIVRGINKKIKF